MADKDKREIGDALGMIETRGLVGMIEAADAMVKTANVVFVGWQKGDAGLVPGIGRGGGATRGRTGRRPRHPETCRRPRKDLPDQVIATLRSVSPFFLRPPFFL